MNKLLILIPGIALSIMLILFLLLIFFIHTFNVSAVVILLILISFFYSILIFVHKKNTIPLPHTLFIILILAGILIRFFYFFLSPDILSDDVYRYFWDGKVQSMGINPFMYSPADDYFTQELKDDFYNKINHKEFATIYPPVSQLFFYLVYKIGGNSFFIIKLFYFFFDFLCAVILYKLYNSKHILLLYILNPLLIVEVYIGMHIDLLALVFLLMSFYFFRKTYFYTSFFFLGISILVKYITLGIIVIYIVSIIKHRKQKSLRNLSQLLSALGLFLGTMIIFFIPYLTSAGTLVFTQLIIYNQYWEFNSIIHPVIRFFAGNATFIIKIFIYSMILLVISITHKMTIENKIRLVILSLLLINGALFPWYLLILIPFFLAEIHYADILLFFSIQISYLVLIKYKNQGIWEDHVMIRVIEYIPFYVVFIYELLKGYYVQTKKNRSYNSGIK